MADRLKQFAQKALREAKLHTGWDRPDEAYEQAVAAFVDRILDEKQAAEFLKSFQAFQARISEWGMLNSLSQTLLKLTAPGVPDTYQGSELWDFSMVDPDNRRPVDYALRRSMLLELSRAAHAAGSDRRSFLRALLDRKSDGRIKMLIHWLALTERQRRPDLFARGAYFPAKPLGPLQNHVFGFCRRNEGELAVIAAGRFFASLPQEKDSWADTRLLIPGLDPAAPLRDLFTGAAVSVTVEADGVAVPASELFGTLPIAFLTT